MDGPRLIKPDAARALVGGLSESTIRRLVKAGLFPQPVVLARDRHDRPLRVAFVEAEILEWNRALVAADRGRRTTDAA